MFKTVLVLVVLSVSMFGQAWAPPIGPAQRHSAMQEAAPFARKYRIRIPLAIEIVRAADQARVPRGLAFRLVKTESSFDSLAVSATGALGLTQVLPSTGKYACPGLDLLKVSSNLRCGFTYLKTMHRRYGDWFVATAAYNLGPSVADTSRTLNDLRYSQMVAGTF